MNRLCSATHGKFFVKRGRNTKKYCQHFGIEFMMMVALQLHNSMARQTHQYHILTPTPLQKYHPKCYSYPPLYPHHRKAHLYKLASFFFLHTL